MFFVNSYQGEGSLTAKQQWLIEIRDFMLNIAMVEWKLFNMLWVGDYKLLYEIVMSSHLEWPMKPKTMIKITQLMWVLCPRKGHYT